MLPLAEELLEIESIGERELVFFKGVICSSGRSDIWRIQVVLDMFSENKKRAHKVERVRKTERFGRSWRGTWIWLPPPPLLEALPESESRFLESLVTTRKPQHEKEWKSGHIAKDVGSSSLNHWNKRCLCQTFHPDGLCSPLYTLIAQDSGTSSLCVCLLACLRSF